jgi:acetyltransferase
MTTRNLDYLFKPRSIALIGAGKRPSSVGAVLAHNLFNAGFDGPVMPVNPKHRAIEGVLAYPDVASLPVTPDLAVIATPAATVPGIVEQLAARGTRAAVIITAGFEEGADEQGKGLRQAFLDAARPKMLRILGPNCLGVLVPGVGLNASFAQLHPRPGKLAFVAQSGAMVTAVLDWASARGIGFSHLVSLGDMADVDFGDMLDYLANEPDTRAILLYVEAVTAARKFISAARAASRTKPVIVVKAGRHAEGARAAASHTGALAGSDAVYDAVFRRAGMLRVLGLDELFAAVETLDMARPPRGDRLAIVTNGGGMGVLATDALMDRGGRLAELAEDTRAALDRVLPATWSHANPVDIIGDAPASRYRDALQIVLRDPGVDAVLVLNCPTAIASGAEAARAVIDTACTDHCPTLLTSWVGDGFAEQGRRLFVEHRLPTYETPGNAVEAFVYLVDYDRRQQALMQTPPSESEDFSPQPARVRAILDKALEKRREWLLEPEAKAVLAAYGVPVVETRSAETPAAAAALAAAIGGPTALKVVSPDITHKSDVGGVALDLQGPTAVRERAEAMAKQLSVSHPEAKLVGFTVQPMVHRPGAYELIVGAMQDAQFGPVLLFGHGGTAVEVVNDKAIGLPPLNMRLAREMMEHTRIFRLLRGYRGLPAANLDAIAMTLLRISQLVIDIPEILELDINPLLADEYGVMALDARVKVAPAHGPAEARLAIRPYPKGLEEPIALEDGRTLLLRPIVPEDELALQAAFARLSPEEIRLRFFAPMKSLPHVQAARFTQIDYDREMALVLTEPGRPGRTEIYGVVRLYADPDNERAEYAIIVGRELSGLGLGRRMMERIVDYARGRGIGEIFGDVLQENAPMLRLCRELGFSESRCPEEQGIVRVTLPLGESGHPNLA